MLNVQLLDIGNISIFGRGRTPSTVVKVESVFIGTLRNDYKISATTPGSAGVRLSIQLLDMFEIFRHHTIPEANHFYPCSLFKAKFCVSEVPIF